MNNITEVVFILDASGSMYDLTEDTIGGFNSMLAKQREKEGEVLISTVTFNNESKVIHDRVSLSEVKNMTKEDYVAGGCTALLDAMGDAIRHISNIHKYIRKEDIPAHTLFVITTDGLENASHKYSSGDIKKMVEGKKELGWEFIFLGANIDAIETAEQYGIDESRAMEYQSDREGTHVLYEKMCAIVNMSRDDTLDESWKSVFEMPEESEI